MKNNHSRSTAHQQLEWKLTVNGKAAAHGTGNHNIKVPEWSRSAHAMLMAKGAYRPTGVMRCCWERSPAEETHRMPSSTSACMCSACGRWCQCISLHTRKKREIPDVCAELLLCAVREREMEVHAIRTLTPRLVWWENCAPKEQGNKTELMKKIPNGTHESWWEENALSEFFTAASHMIDENIFIIPTYILIAEKEVAFYIYASALPYNSSRKGFIFLLPFDIIFFITFPLHWCLKALKQNGNFNAGTLHNIIYPYL